MKRWATVGIGAIMLIAVVALLCQGSTVPDGRYAILSRESGKAVTVDWNTVNENSANIKQWEYQGYAHQVWKIEHVGGGEYRIINHHSGKAMVVNGSTKDDDGANVKQYSYESFSDHHKWRFENAGGGYYRIVSVRSGKCLDLYRYSHENGANIQQWSCHGASNQLWELRPYGQATTSSGPSFSDNLESGGGQWNLANGWSTGSWQGDRCLVGTQNAFATMTAADHWTDYTLTANVALPNKGWLHINVHTDWSGPGRYYVGVSNHTVRLTREWPIGTHKELARSEILHLDTCCLWNEVTLLVGKTRIRVYVNGVRYIDHTDTSKADGVLQDGGISFESQGTAVYVDDVRVVSGFHVPGLRCEIAQMWISAVGTPRADEGADAGSHSEFRLKFAGDLLSNGIHSSQWEGAWSEEYVKSGRIFTLNWRWDIRLKPTGVLRLAVGGYEHDGGDDPLTAAATAFAVSLASGLIPPMVGLPPIDPVTAAVVAIIGALNDNDKLPSLELEYSSDNAYGLSWIPYAEAAENSDFRYELYFEIKCKEWDCP